MHFPFPRCTFRKCMAVWNMLYIRLMLKHGDCCSAARIHCKDTIYSNHFCLFAVGVCHSFPQALWQEGALPTGLSLHWHAHQGTKTLLLTTTSWYLVCTSYLFLCHLGCSSMLVCFSVCRCIGCPTCRLATLVRGSCNKSAASDCVEPIRACDAAGVCRQT